MQTMPQPYNVGDSRLRFIFDDAVFSLNIAAEATFETVARKLGELPNHPRGSLVAIDVRLEGVRVKTAITEDAGESFQRALLAFDVERTLAIASF